MTKTRIEREWVPTKLYLPPDLYAQLMVLRDSEKYSWWVQHCRVGNETELNLLMRYILEFWQDYGDEVLAHRFPEWKEKYFNKPAQLRLFKSEQEQQP